MREDIPEEEIPELDLFRPTEPVEERESEAGTAPQNESSRVPPGASEGDALGVEGKASVPREVKALTKYLASVRIGLRALSAKFEQARDIYPEEEVETLTDAEEAIPQIKAEDAPTAFILSSNWSIAPLLSRGCLLPAAWGDKTDIQFFDDEWSKTLPSGRGQLPGNWVSRIRGDRRNAFPIAVRTKTSRDKSAMGVALSEVDALVFATEEELKLQADTKFDDFDLRQLDINLEVDPSIFTGPEIDITDPSPYDESRLDPGQLRRTDCLAGLTAILPHIVPGKTDWISALGELWDLPTTNGSRAASWIQAILQGLSQNRPDLTDSGIEEALLAATSRVLSESYPLRKGWPGTDILSAIIKEIEKESRSQDDQNILDRWENQCRNLISATEELPALDDSKGVPFRAVMYLLIRGGDIEAIDTDEPHVIGREVKALAKCLASVRIGLRALSAKFKQARDVAPGRIWTELLGDYVLSHLQLRSQTSTPGTQSLSIELESDIPLTGHWNLSSGNERLFKIEVESDPALRHVAESCAAIGWPIEDLGTQGIEVAVQESGSETKVRAGHSGVEGSNPSVISISAKVICLPPLSNSLLVKVQKFFIPELTIKGLKRHEAIYHRVLEQNHDQTRQWTGAIRKDDEAIVLNSHISVSVEDEPKVVRSELKRIALDASAMRG